MPRARCRWARAPRRHCGSRRAWPECTAACAWRRCAKNPKARPRPSAPPAPLRRRVPSARAAAGPPPRRSVLHGADAQQGDAAERERLHAEQQPVGRLQPNRALGHRRAVLPGRHGMAAGWARGGGSRRQAGGADTRGGGEGMRRAAAGGMCGVVGRLLSVGARLAMCGAVRAREPAGQLAAWPGAGGSAAPARLARTAEMSTISKKTARAVRPQKASAARGSSKSTPTGGGRGRG